MDLVNAYNILECVQVSLAVMTSLERHHSCSVDFVNHGMGCSILNDRYMCKNISGRFSCGKVREEDLFNTEHPDVVQATLVELKALEEKRLNVHDRVPNVPSKLMASRRP